MDRSHKVDISGLLAGSRQLMVVDDEVPIEPFEGIVFPQPVRVQLELRQADRMLGREGTVDARVHGAVRCLLEDVDREIHVDVDERIDPSRGRDDDPFGESNVLSGDRLDVADSRSRVVLSALPMGLRCKRRLPRPLCRMRGE